MNISSSTFENYQAIPSEFTCEGNNTNPPLFFSDIPVTAKSLALIMDDPDIPQVVKDTYHIDEWIHWVVWNIPTDTKIINTRVDVGISGKNTRGANAYGGPCPPDREHRYFFRLYALDTLLDLPKETSKKELLKAMKGHILDQAELVGTYVKQANQ